MMRYLNLAVVMASASLVASCGFAPPMTAYTNPAVKTFLTSFHVTPAAKS